MGLFLDVWNGMGVGLKCGCSTLFYSKARGRMPSEHQTPRAFQMATHFMSILVRLAFWHLVAPVAVAIPATVKMIQTAHHVTEENLDENLDENE